MKVSATVSILGPAFVECVRTKGGLGYLLLAKNRAANTDEVSGISSALSMLGVGFFGLIVRIERLTIPRYQST